MGLVLSRLAHDPPHVGPNDPDDLPVAQRPQFDHQAAGVRAHAEGLDSGLRGLDNGGLCARFGSPLASLPHALREFLVGSLLRYLYALLDGP